MIDILPGWTFMEADILRIYSGGPYKGRDGGEIYAITVKLKGDTEAIRSTYRTPLEMDRDLTAITNAWNAWADGAQGKSIRDEFERMRQRLEETEKKLAEWEAESQEKARAEKKPKTRTGKKKPAGLKIGEEEACTMIDDEEDLPDGIREPLKTWVRYKIEKRQAYQETGFKGLLTKTKNACKDFGAEKVSKLIEDCMSSNYAGIMWDRLKKWQSENGKKTASGQFGAFEQNEYTAEEFEEFENSSVAI